MKSLTSVAAAAVAALLCLALPAVPSSSPSSSGSTKIALSDVEGAWLYLESPWGYFDWYWVDPGRNTLQCAGTGNLWVYIHE